MDDHPTPSTKVKIAEDAVGRRSDTVGQSTGVSLKPGAFTGEGSGTGIAGGIYHTRSNFSRASFDRRSIAGRASHDPSGAVNAPQDVEEGDDWRGGHERKKQVFRGRTLLWLAYQSVGVIYGDIGTSPLYVYSSTFTHAPRVDEVVEVLSVIIWSITIMVTLKYILIVLHADNEGEGGTFSCYSLLTRYANITERDPREQVTVRMERHLSQDLRRPNRTIRTSLERRVAFRVVLKVIGVLAVSMVLADGVLTPAQSVLGAVQGLRVVNPDIATSTIVGTSCGILIVLFFIQPLGTTKLAASFAPIVITWLGFNGAFGIYNLVNFDWGVLKAFSPYFALQFFARHKTQAWRMLGGILLSFTGVEALFADLGAFSLRAIQLSWMCYAYPCLLLAYIGQAAFMSINPDAYANPFFASVPPGMLYPSLVVAVLAAIVASQAMITASFQLISQIMKLSYCPQVKVLHTSKVFHGQLYVPFLNWILMIGAIFVTAVYSDTTRLGNAYGVCVMFVTFFDTCMVTLVALVVWKLSPLLIFLPWLFFATIDGLYLSSALNKVPDGAWFTLTVSGVLAGLFLMWRFGKENQWRAEAEDRIRPGQLVRRDDDRFCLADNWGGDPLSIIRGFGVFFDKTGVMTPAVFTHFVTKFVAVPDVAVFFHLHPVEVPTVAPAERYAVSRFTAIPGCYRLVIRHGFMDEVISPDLAALIYEQVRKFVIRQARNRLGLDEAAAAERKLAHEDREDDETAGATTVPPVTVTMPNEKEEVSTTSGGTPTTTGHGTPGKKTTVAGTDDQAGSAVAASSNDADMAQNIRAGLPVELRDAATAAELARLDKAYAAKIMYIVGKGQMRVRDTAPLGRRVLLSVFLWIRDNTRAKIANLRLAMDRVVEVGFIKEI